MQHLLQSFMHFEEDPEKWEYGELPLTARLRGR